MADLPDRATRQRPNASPANDPAERPKLFALTDVFPVQQSFGMTSALPSPRERRLVLLVDDCAESREMYAEYLGDEFAIAQAGTGTEAIDCAVALLPDIVVMDLVLPGMTGLEASRRLKRDPRTHSIPLLVVSGQSEPEVATSAPKPLWDAFSRQALPARGARCADPTRPPRATRRLTTGSAPRRAAREGPASREALVRWRGLAIAVVHLERDVSPSDPRPTLNDLHQELALAIAERLGRERVNDGLGLLPRTRPEHRNLEPRSAETCVACIAPTPAAIVELPRLLECDGIQHGALLPKLDSCRERCAIVRPWRQHGRVARGSNLAAGVRPQLHRHCGHGGEKCHNEGSA